MPALTRRGCWILALVGIAVTFAVWPSAASAALDVTGATIDDSTSTSSPPGGVMRARVEVRLTGGDNWHSTRVQIGSDTRCVDTDNEDSDGTHSDSFDVTAPGRPRVYDVTFTAFEGGNCSGKSGERVLDRGLRVTRPRRNPDLPPKCGINVMLVLDESGSIDSSGATDDVRDATRAFLNGLKGTGSKVSIVDFSTQAQRPVDYTIVTDATMASTFNPYINNQYDPGGWTNWEDAFHEVKVANDAGPVADLVVFMTDGDPTAMNTDSGGVEDGLTEGDVRAMRRAKVEADLVKGQGSHILALGVGAAVTKENSARRLTAVSGFDQFPGATFEKADYTLVEDFAELADALRQIAIALCRASVTVTKLVDEGDGVYRPDAGWTFTANVEVPGGYSWVQPAPPTDPGEKSQTTNDEGVATFQWKPTNPEATSTISMSEEVHPGYQFVDYECEVNAPGRTRITTSEGSTLPAATGQLGPNEFAKCTVRNRILPGTIEIEKQANPQGSQEFSFTGPFEPFTLVDNAAGDSSSRTFNNLTPGTYTFREEVPENWELTGVVCSDPAVVITGPEVAITIGPGDSVVCTYHDTRTNPPVPPEPPVPPTPPTPPPGPPPPPPPPPTPPPSTELRVVKTMPRVARIGQRVRFRLTVTNVGSVTARRVHMVDIPPGAANLAALRSSTRARVSNRGAIWKLGRLAPGARRTIRGSVLITGGTPGLKTNLVAAGAVNAKLAGDRANTRLRAAQRGQAPAVTG